MIGKKQTLLVSEKNRNDTHVQVRAQAEPAKPSQSFAAQKIPNVVGFFLQHLCIPQDIERMQCDANHMHTCVYKKKTRNM